MLLQPNVPKKSRSQINVINVDRTANASDRFIDEQGNVWCGTQFGTLVIPALASDIYSNTAPYSVDERLKGLSSSSASIVLDIAALQAEDIYLQNQINALSGGADLTAKIRTINTLGVL